MEQLIELKAITKTWPISSTWFKARKKIFALEDINLSLKPGEILAVLGESGSGKSTLGRVLARLETPDAGRYLLQGHPQQGQVRNHQERWNFGGKVQMIFQDPFSSLNPVHSVGYHIIRALKLHHQPESKALELLETVGLRPAQSFVDKFPFELSGGQRQRVAIARALAVQPALLIADEPTSMLDVSIRMDILNLLKSLREQYQLALLMITHDLPSAFYLSERIAVMYAGQIVESGATADIFHRPTHPYTQLLLQVAQERITKKPRPKDDGMAAAQLRETKGCLFAARCPKVFSQCLETAPALTKNDQREFRCHAPS